MQLCVQLVWLHRVHSGKALSNLQNTAGGASSPPAPVLPPVCAYFICTLPPRRRYLGALQGLKLFGLFFFLVDC